MNLKTGATIAAAVAFAMSMTACGGDDTGTTTDPIKCQGINECAGTAECAGPNGENDCQGQNECAGQGWVSVDSEAECTDQGGTIIS